MENTIRAIALITRRPVRCGTGLVIDKTVLNPFPNIPLQVMNTKLVSWIRSDRHGLLVIGPLWTAIAQYRGAEAVLATLWNVADASTAEFKITFYTALATPGTTKAQALRTAQLTLIDRDNTRAARNKTDYSDPYHWAPYILMGNWK